ncbi:MAG: glutamate synthase subunit beta [Acidimicrobiales bacterium]
MGDPTAFLRHRRELPALRPVPVRLADWREVYQAFPRERVEVQASRCMDCGIPFCHHGCPLGNLIPEWNDLVSRGKWREAADRLHATNNFPDFTGRLCPAPCEPACVLGISDEPVTIKQVEHEIADRAVEDGWTHPRPAPPTTTTGRSVAVVGSGPAGLAAAQQLTRAGHRVVVFERADRIGGLLRYGIPEFKMEKSVLDARLGQLEAEGTELRVNAHVGGPPGAPGTVAVEDIRAGFDAVVLAGGATVARDLPVPGRDLAGIHQAMEYLPLANRVQAGDLAASPVTAAGRRVVIIGGGDTGADCLGTAHRQGAVSVHQLEIMARPPDQRDPSTPWPLWPLVLRTSAAHDEGGERLFSVSTARFLGDDGGRVAALRARRVTVVPVEGGGVRFEPVAGEAEIELGCDLVLLALGFVGPEPDGLLGQLGVALDARGNVARTGWATNVEGVFACGDMARGQSLVVWAIAEGRSAAAAVDHWLMGRTSLPAPLPVV